MKLTIKQLSKIVKEAMYLPSEIDVSPEGRSWSRQMRDVLSQEEQEAVDQLAARGPDDLAQAYAMGGLPPEIDHPEKKTKTFPIADKSTLDWQLGSAHLGGRFNYKDLDHHILPIIQDAISHYENYLYNPPDKEVNPKTGNLRFITKDRIATPKWSPSFERGLRRHLQNLPLSVFGDLISLPGMIHLVADETRLPKFKEQIEKVADQELMRLKMLRAPSTSKKQISEFRLISLLESEEKEMDDYDLQFDVDDESLEGGETVGQALKRLAALKSHSREGQLGKIAMDRSHDLAGALFAPYGIGKALIDSFKGTKDIYTGKAPGTSPDQLADYPLLDLFDIHPVFFRVLDGKLMEDIEDDYEEKVLKLANKDTKVSELKDINTYIQEYLLANFGLSFSRALPEIPDLTKNSPDPDYFWLHE